MNEKEIFNKMNEDKNYRSEVLVDLNVTMQLAERITYTTKNKISPQEYKLAVVSLEVELQDLQQENQKLKELAGGLREERDYLFNKLSFENKQLKDKINKIENILNNQMDYREFVDIVNAIEDVIKGDKE